MFKNKTQTALNKEVIIWRWQNQIVQWQCNEDVHVLIGIGYVMKYL